MSKIKLLDNATINKIAAGEVVERPGSIVKELMENSIDSGATAITVEIRDGGISFIRVTDNGCGIDKEEARLSFMRHATSKISHIEDLEKSMTLGFRGEALSSIAACSQTELISKTRESDLGIMISVAGGEFSDEKSIGCTDGTSVIVRNVFYNLPARRKFLKKASAESGYISDIVSKIAMGNPSISIKFINNGNLMLHTPGDNNLKNTVFAIYGKEMSEKMLEISYSDKELSVWGLIGKPELSRSNRSYENLFINGRVVKNTVVSQAVEEAYKTRLMIGKFPVYALNLKISPTDIDVNVHPAKITVKFSDDSRVYDFIYKAVFNALKKAVLIPEVEINPPKEETQIFKNISQKFEQETLNLEAESKTKATKYPTREYIEEPTSKVDRMLNKNPGGMTLHEKIAMFETFEPETEEKPFETNVSSPKKLFNDYKIIGQLFGTYWVIEEGEKLFLIDQHAAHERILFEKFMDMLHDEKAPSQILLFPFIPRLSEHEKAVFEENRELFKKFGFKIEDNGENIAITSVPILFLNPAPSSLFIDLLDVLSEALLDDIYGQNLLTVATIACKAAVKGNDKLSKEESEALIHKLMELKNPFSCPHGRPTIIEVSKYELEKRFKRIQN